MTTYFLQQVINALSIGSLYAVMAIGLAMVFSILRLVNFAHGDLMMTAAYMAAFTLFAGLPLGFAIIVMILGTIALGLLMELIAYRPIRGRPEVAALLTSFAVGEFLQNSALLITRSAGRPVQIAFPAPALLSGVVNIGDLTVSRLNIMSLLVGGVALVIITVFVTRTTLGLSMRAAAEDLTAARLMGIKLNRVIGAAFAIGSALAALAGLLFAAQAGQINPYMGFTPVLKAFIAAVIGGFGSIAGAVVGGYALGALEVVLTALPGLGDILPTGSTSPQLITFLKHWLPSSLTSYRDAFVFVVLIGVLLFRPNGIVGKRE